MADFWTKVTVGLLKGVAFVYDIITFLPYYLIDKPSEKLKISRRIKARPVEPTNPGSSWRALESFDKLTETVVPGCTTLDELFLYVTNKYQDQPCLGTRELLEEQDEVQPNGKVFKKSIYGRYQWLTYQDVDKQASRFGAGLLSLGQKPKQNICLFAETRAEWMVAAVGCFKYNLPVVTLYSTLGDEAIIHGVNESEVTIIITSNLLLDKFKRILTRIPGVKHLVYMNHGKKPDTSNFPHDVQVHSMLYVQQLGSKSENAPTTVSKPTKDDIAVIMYTSGSTGIPKGVMISNVNLLSGMSGQANRVPKMDQNDIYIGYLPLAHVLELSAELTCLTHGVRVGYSSPLTLTDQSGKIKKGSKGDATELRPTLMATVPVIMDRLYKNVWEKVNDGSTFQKALFIFAYSYKKKQMLNGFQTRMLDKIIFKRICRLLGGRIRMLLSGGAPLSADTQQFMNICFCCPIGQGYGLTETCGAGSIHDVTDMSTGRVGAPLTCCQIKLVNWEEGGYNVDDTPNPRGEIIIGGNNVAMGYYKNPEKTKEDFFESDGYRWFSTGDIGEFQKDGCLKIIDRKKDLVKLQTGEYVSLGKVETVLKMSALVDNCCAYADSTRMFTVCLIVPNVKKIKSVAETFGINTHDMETICENKQIQQYVMDCLKTQANTGAGKLERFEIPVKITLCAEPWTPDTGLVTDAFKLKRKNIQLHYQADIDKMYS
ncbi:hypothetical protein LSH36_824g03044 [Paralvinella palmiformis]|uniref:long-chain-fatty-acid--CoA ligase n=1 Tax=Paralvinella palmiformis TaxID=53620 RepID=A0AAD9MTK7_9ANNE|nr:hypothetical protein LSH36_824g03044 [Paralvinella palmiformis]